MCTGWSVVITAGSPLQQACHHSRHVEEGVQGEMHEHMQEEMQGRIATVRTLKMIATNEIMVGSLRE